MILPPSIIEKNLLVDVPDDYGCYMYRLTDTIPKLRPWYLGIKKDKLPEHGGDYYWGTSQNEEFNLLVQGDEPRFILEILELKPRIDYEYLQLKENRMLLEVPNIKTNPSTYNLSYGIPPIGKNSLPTREYFEWFKKERATGKWDGKPELVKALIMLHAIQTRALDNPSFVKDISVEVKEVAGNTSNMNTVLLFEGVGGLFGFEEGSDMVAGTTHGLKGAKMAGARKMTPCRVPFEVLKGKSKYFIEALAGFDNHMDSFNYDPNWVDGKKLLLKLHAAHGTDPMSELAAEQVRLTYGLPTRQITKSQEYAVTDIELGKKPNVKWRVYTKKELKDERINRTTTKKLAIVLSSGKYYEEPIWMKFRKDEIEKGGLKRQTMDVVIHHPPNTINKEKWDLNYSNHVEKINWLLPGKTINFKVLDHEQADTVKSNEED